MWRVISSNSTQKRTSFYPVWLLFATSLMGSPVVVVSFVFIFGSYDQKPSPLINSVRTHTFKVNFFFLLLLYVYLCVIYTDFFKMVTPLLIPSNLFRSLFLLYLMVIPSLAHPVSICCRLASHYFVLFLYLYLFSWCRRRFFALEISTSLSVH